MRFTESILQTYPYPLAVSAKRVNDATESVEQYLCLANLFEVSLKYLAFISMAQYLRDETVDDEVQKRLARLARPTLGVWNEILRTCVGFYADNRDRTFVVLALRDGYATKLRSQDPGAQDMETWYRYVADYLKDETKGKQERISLQNLLDLMVVYRNKAWGHGIRLLTPEFCERHTQYFWPGMQGLLDYVAFLAHYPLRYVKEVRKVKGQDTHVMFDYTGPAWQQGLPYIGRYAQERRLYLCDQQGVPLLSIHPLFVVHERRLYVLEYHEQAKSVGYSDCETGKPFEPDKLSSFLITKLADDQHNKLGDAELPVPPEQDGLEVDEKKLMPSLAELMGQMNDEALQCLAIGLGESLRIGQFWLGIEFLLMGLSKQDGMLTSKLKEVGVEDSTLRGVLRGLVDVRNKGWREHRDVESIGAVALPELQEIDPAQLAALYGTDKLPKAVVTPRMLAMLREAVRLAGEDKVTPTHLLLAALSHPRSIAVNLLLGMIVEAGHDPHEWIQQLARGAAVMPANESEGPEKQPPPPASASPKGKGLLGQLGRDITELARAGQLRPAIGESAHKAMVQIGLILQQTQANNPILLGDPGVGKTAIVEGFAYRLATDSQVVPILARKRIVDLPPAALLAGTKYRGELEDRLQKLLAEVNAASGQTIVFIDEIHTILGGKAEGGLGAISDALKPALGRGEFPCIGATTVGEYRCYIEADPALARRFTPVWIEEPWIEEALEIVKAVAQQHLGPSHNVRYPDEVIEEAVRLAVRYIHDEFLPGKAIKLLDQAGPRVTMGGSLRGVAIDKDQPVGGEVTVEVVRGIVAERTGIPLTRLSEDESQKLLQLESSLKQRVKGQDEAVREVARAVKRARAGLADPRRPMGVFLFAGPSGVGKTELALALAEALFDDEQAILRLDMSEYMEKHQVSRLIGSPPGYVGHEEEGQLTGHLRRRPYSVILMDEIDKAHADVQHLFLQLFDAGRLTDSHGRLADGRNAIFIMTSNLGAKVPTGFVLPQMPSFERQMKAAIEQHFTPEFLNRVDRIVYFAPLQEEALLAIFDKQFKVVADLLLAKGIQVEVEEGFKRVLIQNYTDVTHGARPLQRAIEDEIVAPLTEKLIAGEIKPGTRVVVRGGSDMAAEPKPQGDKLEQAEPAAQPPARRAPAGFDDRDNIKARNQRLFDLEAPAMLSRMRERGLEVEIDSRVKDFVCDPFWTTIPTPQAVRDLIEKPLLRELDEGKYQPGDRVRVTLYVDRLEFSKVAGGVS